jgi:hypothetical protein
MKGKIKKIDQDKLPVYQIVIDEFDETGISLISLVDEPAIMVKGMAFKNTSIMSFKEVGDKQIIVGPALIPDMRIYREDEKYGKYYVIFSKETIEKMVEKFNKYGSNRKINIDHSNMMVDAFIIEDWIVEDIVYDKSRKYGIEVPVGTYMIMVKIEDKKFWNEEIKGNGKFGFSIEGMLGQQLISLSKEEITIDDLTEEDLFEIFGVYEKGVPHYTADGKLYEGPTHKDATGRLMTGAEHTEDSEYLYHEDELTKVQLKSYTDYPDGVKSNAKKVLEFTEKNGWGSCGTPVGKVRANQLAKGEPISLDTIKRMYSYLSRHEVDLEKSKTYSDGCGKIMYDAWGGKAALGWSRNKLRELGELKEEEKKEFSEVFTTDSSNVDRIKYFEDKKELVVKFNDGSYYTYFNIDENVFFSIIEGDAICRTEGEGEYGSWFIGKTPSVGAAIWKYLIDRAVSYKEGGSFR